MHLTKRQWIGWAIGTVVYGVIVAGLNIWDMGIYDAFGKIGWLRLIPIVLVYAVTMFVVLGVTRSKNTKDN